VLSITLGFLGYSSFLFNNCYHLILRLIDKLRAYNPLNNDLIIRSLKSSWRNYKARASLVVTEEIDVLQWHYGCWLENKEYLTDEKYRYESCMHCNRTKHSSCTCVETIMNWWEVASLLALILPSSAPAERVFSILNRMWTDLQTRALSETIRASMFLACNKRRL